MSSSAEYIEEYKRVILPSTISENEDKVLCRGDGVWVWDEDGNKYFDAASQVSMVNIGHNHPKLISWTRKYYAKAAREKIITSSINTDCYARS
ncbi:aminotransferase class III-fold pyridoxal phosphate-dependent enzyme, partial [Candidatus Daviesbacteria bacterium]|nr:aminotransferase class III-fold pyridoxal phosphate-dependent enzyme [Candidatus Daviesbacteria bacterium]